MQVRKQQLELDMEQQTGSKQEKEYVKAIYCHPVYLTSAEHIMENARLDEAQAGIKIARRNINNLRHADDTTLMAESEEELKSLLMSERGEWKSWLKAQHSENEDHGIWSHHFMGIDEETVETVSDFIFLGSKITADVDCAMELKDAYSLEGTLWPT